MAEDRTTEEAAIVAAVLDYFDGWFDGDAIRMARALHPDLAKRALERDGQALNGTTAAEMIEATIVRPGPGSSPREPGPWSTPTPPASRRRCWTSPEC